MSKLYILPGDSDLALNLIIKNLLSKLNTRITVFAYSLTHPKIIDALIKAMKENQVPVRILLDYSQTQQTISQLDWGQALLDSGATVTITSSGSLPMHLKLMVIETRAVRSTASGSQQKAPLVVRGSTNFSRAAFGETNELEATRSRIESEALLKLYVELEAYGKGKYEQLELTPPDAPHPLIEDLSAREEALV